MRPAISTRSDIDAKPAHKSGIRLPSAEVSAFVIAVFLLGGIMAMLGAPPFPTLKKQAGIAVEVLHELRRVRPQILERHRYDGEGVVTRTAEASPGFTLVQGILPGGPQIRMLDLEGREIHRWEIDFFEIWPEPTHVIPQSRLPRTHLHYHTQGFWPRADGSVLVNIGELGSVMLDRCSRPLWTVDRMTHHSVTQTPDGKFWIPSHISLAETPDHLFPRAYGRAEIEEMLIGTHKHYHNSILLVNGEGRIEKEFSVLKAVHDAKLEHALYASLQEEPADPMHLNDIEVVTPELAARIDGVEPGDLLVSLRDMHMLAILDQADGRLKWHQQGPWLRQHDPDIAPDGLIEIFNNRSAALSKARPESQILSFDAATGETRILHPTGEDDRFFTHVLGAQQRLPNGNMLISESLAGRVLEVTPEGQIAWDYRQPYDAETASLVEVTTRVPIDFFHIENWNCEES